MLTSQCLNNDNKQNYDGSSGEVYKTHG